TAGNLASKNLLQKVGFHQEGELRDCYWLNGRWHNDWLFGLLRRDYHQPGPPGE
ncbi:GNAT family N-acetyltransferase, partial [Klebsiella michiganensis]